MEHIFSKSLRIANVSKLGMYLVHYLKENTYETANACKSYIPYNNDFINRDCFYSGPDGKQTKYALKNLRDKNIILYDRNNKTIKLNYDVRTWTVTPEQYEKITKLVLDENLTYEQGEKDPIGG